jgi:hypothetical protein
LLTNLPSNFSFFYYIFLSLSFHSAAGSALGTRQWFEREAGAAVSELESLRKRLRERFLKEEMAAARAAELAELGGWEDVEPWVAMWRFPCLIFFFLPFVLVGTFDKNDDH